MKWLFLLSLLLLSLTGLRAAEEVDDPDVIVLTDDNFDEEIAKHDLILVEFYAPWCGHCKQLAPEYAKAATRLLANDPPIALAKLDATKHGKTAGRFGVSGYPTLKVFRDGKESPYNGPRKEDGIVAYMKKQVGPAIRPLSTVEEVDQFVNTDPALGYAVVGFFPKEGSSKSKVSQLSSSFSIIANKLRDTFPFGKVTDEAVAQHFGVEPGSEALVAFKTFDDKKTVYSGDSKTKHVEDFVKMNSLPIVGEWTEATADLYQKRELPIAKFFMTVDRKLSPKNADYFVNRLKKVAQEHAGKILFTTVHIPKFSGQAEEYGIKGKDAHGLVIEKGWTEKYKMDTPFTADNVRAFVNAYLEDELEQWVKSEPEPEDNTGPVKVVTGKSFHKIVNDPTKDVLIEFYAPWCGHCNALKPKYEELGRKVKDVDSVVIAKLDATANDFPRNDFRVSGYPTIYLVPSKEGAKPILYEGEREVQAMYNFIKKNAKTSFSKDKKDKKKKKKSKADKEDL